MCIDITVHSAILLYIFVDYILCRLYKKNSDKQINKLIIPNYFIKLWSSYTQTITVIFDFRSNRQFLSTNIDVPHGSVLGITIYHAEVQLDKFAANT